MLIYWNAGQPGFWDPTYDGQALDLKTPGGFEPLIASDPFSLRKEVFDLLTPAEPALWLDPDPGVGALVPTFSTSEEAALKLANKKLNGIQKNDSSDTYQGVSRVAVVRLEKPNWIVVCFRGTTPSPYRGLLREGQVNSMAGQEVWAEAPTVMPNARVHRGYAAAYRSVLGEVESTVVEWAKKAHENEKSEAPKIVVAGHSLGGALAVLCATRYQGVSRVAVVRLEKPNWIVVCFRGTTPSPYRGLLREGQVNSMAGQEVWAEAPTVMPNARVHRGYAAAYRSVLGEVESTVVEWAKKAHENEKSEAPKIVVAGHSLGGALAVLCATRLAHDVDIERIRRGVTSVTSGGTDQSTIKSSEVSDKVSCVTFGQPRVGDSNFRQGVDEASDEILKYTRVVRGGDLFARVPTSGVWLPSSNGDQLGVEYLHAGAMVWTEAVGNSDTTTTDGGRIVHTKKGESTPSGFNIDLRMVNPLGVARDHAGYAYFFDDEQTRKEWPKEL